MASCSLLTTLMLAETVYGIVTLAEHTSDWPAHSSHSAPPSASIATSASRASNDFDSGASGSRMSSTHGRRCLASIVVMPVDVPWVMVPLI